MKTTALFLLFFAGYAAWGQTPQPAADNTATGETDLRQLLREPGAATPTNAPALSSSTWSPVPPPSHPGNIASTNSGITAVAAPAAMPVSPAISAPAPVAQPAAAQTPPVRINPRRSVRPTPPAPDVNPAPTAQAPPIPARAQVSTPTAPPEQIIAARTINFPAVELNRVLDFYQDLVGRTILRAPNLPNPTITLVTQTALTKTEAIQALDAVLAMNGIAMIDIGDKFVKAVPQAQADAAGEAQDTREASDLPDLGPYVTRIVQVKYSKPSELVPVLTTFGNAKSIQAVDSSGIIVIRDYSENVKRMLEMINQIDVTVQSDFKCEVIPIKYALASDIASALSSVGGAGSSTTSVGHSASSSLPASGSAGGIGGYSPNGSIGTQNNRPGTTPGTAAGTPSSGASFSDRLRSIINRAASSGEVQILGQTKIIADERTNSLLVFATEQDMQMIKDIIGKLDVVLAQVLIESLIMEVSLDNSQTLGISYLQHPKTFGNVGTAGAVNNVGFLNPSSFVSAATNGIASLGSGFSYLARWDDDLDITATAIAGNDRVNVLSRPSIQTSHAVAANLFIGSTVPYITGTTFGSFSGATSSSVYEEKQVGITLNVLPLINPDGLVVMDIQQDIEQLGTPTTIDGNPVPTTTKRSASAKIAVRDRETVVLGGFISNTKSTTRSGVPLLKDIPLLGYLFRSTADSNARTELIVLMRPTVLPTPEAAAAVVHTQKNMLPGVRRAEADEDKFEKSEIRSANKKLGGPEDASDFKTVPPAN